jgi:hypothetical protein
MISSTNDYPFCYTKVCPRSVIGNQSTLTLHLCRNWFYMWTRHCVCLVSVVRARVSLTVSGFLSLPAKRAGIGRSRDWHGSTTNTVDTHNARGDFEVSVQSRTHKFRYEFCENGYISLRQLHNKETIDNRYVNVELSHAIAVTSKHQYKLAWLPISQNPTGGSYRRAWSCPIKIAPLPSCVSGGVSHGDLRVR